MSTIVDILTFISKIHIPSKSFITRQTIFEHFILWPIEIPCSFELSMKKSFKTLGPDIIAIFKQTVVFGLCVGAQWLSSRVLDSRPWGRGFEPYRRHSVVVLEQDKFILA